MREKGYNQLQGYGQGNSLGRDDCERLLHTLFANDILKERIQVNKAGFTNGYVMVRASRSPVHS